MSFMRLIPPRQEMEQAFLRSDGTYDGIFFTGVRTTGIFCRPSCTARKPRVENVEFFATAGEAMYAGYRACLRCRPVEAGQPHPDWVRRLIEAAETRDGERITDQDIRNMGIDPVRARRYFLRTFGMTFQAFCRGRRLAGAFDRIREGADLDDAGFDSGFESHSGFREAFARVFGKPPGGVREDDCIRMAWMDTPLGPMVAGATCEGICLLEFTDRRMLEAQFETVRRRFNRPAVPAENEHLRQLRTELGEYFAAARRVFTVPLIYPGTEFEQRVWAELLRIPYGQTRSYEELAAALGNAAAQRAVGRANGMNRIAIVIPCHRVINKSGELGGYGGGLWRKRVLLDLERTGVPVAHRYEPLSADHALEGAASSRV